MWATAPLRYDHDYGWQLQRPPGTRVQVVEDKDGTKHFVLPLCVVENGKARASTGLWLTLAEAEQIHAELCLVLPDEGRTPGELAPCQTGPTGTEIAGRA